MITFFTTTKKFIGHNLISQLNAIKSWVCQEDFESEVLVFGEEEEIEILRNIPNVTIVSYTDRNENEVPYIDYMFAKANEIARYPICCYINADIILLRKFFIDIHKIHESIQNNYLLVGQRCDMDITTSISFEQTDWETILWKQHSGMYNDHPPAGSDYFVFPKGQYASGTMPRLLVGRPGWDLWMIFNARKRNLKAIDLSFSNKVVHQNHEYSHKPTNLEIKKKDDFHNYNFLPKGQEYIHTLFSCDFTYSDEKIRRNFARNDLRRYFETEELLFGLSFFKKVQRKAAFLLEKVYFNILYFILKIGK